MAYTSDGDVLFVAVTDVNGVVITGFDAKSDDHKLFTIPDRVFSLHSSLGVAQFRGEECLAFIGQALDIDASLPCQIRLFTALGYSQSLRLDRDSEHIICSNGRLFFCRWREGRIDVFDGNIQVKYAYFDVGTIPFPAAIAIWERLLIVIVGQNMYHIPLKLRQTQNIEQE
jgi:hypothetical protein